MSSNVCYLTLDWLCSIELTNIKGAIDEVNRLTPNLAKVIVGDFSSTKLSSEFKTKLSSLKHVYGYGLSHVPTSKTNEDLTTSSLIMSITIDIVQGNLKKLTVFTVGSQFEVLRTLALQSGIELELHN